MAENLRQPSPDPTVEAKRAALGREACRQYENCLYMSTQLYIWLRRIRRQKRVLIVLQTLVTAAAGVAALKDILPDYIVVVLVIAAALLPHLAKALDIETSVKEAGRAAAQFKSLQDRFRVFANITVLGNVDDAETRLRELMEDMDSVRGVSLTPPEWTYEKAHEKIKRGDYKHSVDEKRSPCGDHETE